MSVIFINPYRFKTNTDPFFSNVSLLLHGDGANGSTTFTDSSPNKFTLTRFGNTVISTAQSRFSGSSIFFDGVGDYLTTPSSNAFAFGTGDYTIELWVYFSALSLNTGLVTLAGYFSVYLKNANPIVNRLAVFANGSDRIFSSTVMPLQSWVHVALTRSSSNVRLFVNGVNEGSTYVDTNNYPASQVIQIAESNFGGYIDDLRITKGVARYTSNFTPPTAPFPDA